MTSAWAQRQEELLSDCIVSPDIFNPMIDRLAEFVVPYQQALETEAGQRNLHLYLQDFLPFVNPNLSFFYPICTTGSRRIRFAS